MADQTRWTAEQHLEEACRVLGYAEGGGAEFVKARVQLARAQMEMVVLKAERFGWSKPVPVQEAPRVQDAQVPVDDRPHSRACGFRHHEHGPDCAADCPTCGILSRGGS